MPLESGLGVWIVPALVNGHRGRFLLDTGSSVIVVGPTLVGDAVLREVPVVLHDPGPGVDEILGNTLLSQYLVTVDADRRQLGLRALDSYGATTVYSSMRWLRRILPSGLRSIRGTSTMATGSREPSIGDLQNATSTCWVTGRRRTTSATGS